MSVIVLTPEATSDRQEIGGKAAGIVRMLQLGMPVPPAFTIPTAQCGRFHDLGGAVAQDVIAALPEAMRELEAATGRTFGSGGRPLLVSVRSGAATSMPGMMDTVLNLGMTPDVQQAFAQETGDPAFAADLARRFEQQFTHVVGHEPSADPWEQLEAAIRAVFSSWMSRRAVTYRKERGIAEDGGTAVTVQAMVFGNLDADSGTGVLFTRNPITGDPAPFGEYLPRGQGEDVVSGSHDPKPLDELPAALRGELLNLASILEGEGQDVQDIEFTVQSGKLWLLQTRAAKRTADAALRLAVAMANEGLITRTEALRRVSADQVASLLGKHVDPKSLAKAHLHAEGSAACSGVATGVVVTDVDEAEDRANAGESIILARQTTNPDDVHAMAVVAGIVTEVGGATSHAAVVSRELDVPCVVGCGLGTVTELSGRLVTLDACNGRLYDGALPVVNATEGHADVAAFELWARDAGGSGATLPDLLRSLETVNA